MKYIPLLPEKYDELSAKLKRLETVGRTEVSEAIRLAKEFGDLSENAEYTAAKNAQEKMEIEIARLTEILSNAYPLDLSKLDTDSVSVGNVVKLYDEEFDEEVTYRLVSSIEANSSEGKVSDESPIGKALIGAKAGQVVRCKTPNGVLVLKVLEISK